MEFFLRIYAMSLSQLTPYEHAVVNGLYAGFTVDSPVPLSSLSAMRTKISLIFLAHIVFIIPFVEKGIHIEHGGSA
jgi:hypothetical protein